MFKFSIKNSKLYQAMSYAYNETARRQYVTHEPSAYRHVGQGTVIQAGAQITHPGRVWLGSWSTIMGSTFINSMGGLHVGNYVGIGFRCTILTFNHRYRNSKTLPFDDGIFLQPVILRDYVWVGWNSTIFPGVEVGEGGIIAMGSVVTKNVPPHAIVMGNPAEVIGCRSREHFETCKSEGRANPHRVLEVYDKFEEVIPLMTKKRYAKELQDLGMLPVEPNEPTTKG